MVGAHLGTWCRACAHASDFGVALAPSQAVKHRAVDMQSPSNGPGPWLVARPRHRRRRSPPGPGIAGLDGQGRRRRMPVPGVPVTVCTLFGGHGFHLEKSTCNSRSSGPRPASCSSPGGGAHASALIAEARLCNATLIFLTPRGRICGFLRRGRPTRRSRGADRPGSTPPPTSGWAREWQRCQFAQRLAASPATPPEDAAATRPSVSTGSPAKEVAMYDYSFNPQGPGIAIAASLLSFGTEE